MGTTTKMMSLQIYLKYKLNQESNQLPHKKLRLLFSMFNQISQIIFRLKIKSKRPKFTTSSLSLMMRKISFSLKDITKNKKISLKTMLINTKLTMMTICTRTKIKGKMISSSNFTITTTQFLKLMRISFRQKNRAKSMHYNHKMKLRNQLNKQKISIQAILNIRMKMIFQIL